MLMPDLLDFKLYVVTNNAGLRDGTNWKQNVEFSFAI